MVDPGSFQEIGGLAGNETYEGNKLISIMPAGRVLGWCTLNGRKVIVNGDDATVRHDLPTKGREAGRLRNVMGYGETLALQWRLPYIRFLDAPGASVRHYEAVGRPEFVSLNAWIEASARLLLVAPTVSAVLGSIGGKPAVETCLSHFNVMVKGTSHTFPGGPPVVKAALGYEIHKEDLGGWKISAQTGITDAVAENEKEAFTIIRRFLSYLPDNVWEMPVFIPSPDDPFRREEALLSVVPEDINRAYDPYEILRLVLDHDSLFEIAPTFGSSYITALARANGYPVGVIANNPKSSSAGVWDGAAIEKVFRLLELCDTFHLPVVCFVNEPGFVSDPEAERRGIVRAAARLVQGIRRTKMPWISFIVGRIIDVATSLALRPRGMNARYAWPSASFNLPHRESDPELLYRAAEVFGAHGVIDPRETRPLLCGFVESAQKILRTQLGPGAGPSYRP